MNATLGYGFPIGPGTLRPSVNWSYVGSSYASIFETPYYFIPSRRLLGANLDYEVGSLLFEAYGTNLANLTYITDSLGNDWQYGAPRQYGFRFNYAFGGTGGG
jgi:iron complex outermembrane receptor protein